MDWWGGGRDGRKGGGRRVEGGRERVGWAWGFGHGDGVVEVAGSIARVCKERMSGRMEICKELVISACGGFSPPPFDDLSGQKVRPAVCLRDCEKSRPSGAPDGSRGLQPTERRPEGARRGATLEFPPSRAFKCRSATRPASLEHLGLKPTATVSRPAGTRPENRLISHPLRRGRAGL